MRGRQTSVYKNIQLVLNKEGFEKQAKQLRDKWNIPTEGLDHKALHVWFAYMIRSDAYSDFLEDVSKLKKSFGLQNKWSRFLVWYLTTGEESRPKPLRSGRDIRAPRVSYLEPKSSNDSYQIQIHITAETRVEDVKEVWQEVKRLQKTLPDFDATRHRPKLKRDLNTIKLHSTQSYRKSYETREDLWKEKRSVGLESIVKGKQRLERKLKK